MLTQVFCQPRIAAAARRAHQAVLQQPSLARSQSLPSNLNVQYTRTYLQRATAAIRLQQPGLTLVPKESGPIARVHSSQLKERTASVPRLQYACSSQVWRWCARCMQRAVVNATVGTRPPGPSALSTASSGTPAIVRTRFAEHTCTPASVPA